MQTVCTNRAEGDEMDLQNIQEQLNTEFAKESTRIIFWFDDKGEYEDEVAELCLDNATLHILDGANWLYTKWLLHEQDTEGKYLVYAPFSRPSDAENPLADLYYYSVPYYTDRISQMSQEIGIDNRFKEHMAQYGNFWKNKVRIEKFKSLGIDHFNVEMIDIGLIAVLTEVKIANFEEIVRQLLLTDATEYIKALENNNLLERFWQLCNKYFGYDAENPNLDDLAACMVITYAASALKTSVPTVMKSYVLKKRNDVVVFVRNIMDNVSNRIHYDELAEKIDKSLRFTAKISDEIKKDSGSIQLVDIFACDAFSGIDDILINWCLDKLNDEILDAQIDGMNIAQIADQRISKAFHYGEKYQNEYKAIKYAYLMMKSVSLMEYTSDVAVLVQDYQKETYLIDSYYRWFYYAYDQIEENDRFSEARLRVENIYSNTYLQKLVPKWNDGLDDETVASIGLIKQEDFFKHYLRAYDGKDRVIVIISDALRYECAKELMSKLELDEKCDARMDAMIGVLPSVTSLGMASLLPHKELYVDAEMNVTVDGNSCGDIGSRDKVLKVQNENNIAVSFDEIYKNRGRAKELLQEKNVVYVYHNQVDARGDKQASENEVFRACEEAIREIVELIHQLTGDVSATKYIITADHGFLYKRDKLQEFDKVSFRKEICEYSNKRFLLTTEKVDEQGMLSRARAYLDKLYVTTPIGADIFKVPGGGQNYVHGGSSIQEMLIPVIEVKTAKGKMKTDFVDVILTSVSRKVTNLITYFDFIQTEKVTEVMKARNVIAYFATESGEKISFDVPLVANSREDAPEKRAFHEKFTLKSREYKYGDKYYLHLVDANDEKNILHSYEFMIDIAFVDDFGF